MITDLATGIRALLDDGGSDVARDRIAAERDAVDRLLSDAATPPVYGFTTLLGHLDDTSAAIDDQLGLLEAHLVGPTTMLPAEWGRLLARVKLAQLAHGGSGIHPQTHAALLAAAAPGSFDDAPLQGNWTTSYGSGDVVPGAWLVAALRADGLQLRHSGDLIALINGHFVSTAAALVVVDRFSALAAEALDTVRTAHRESTGVQPPVTLRDPDPLEAAVEASLSGLLVALRDRLSDMGGNPRFEFSAAGVRTVSAADFLDFRLTGALTQAVQTCGQLGAYLKAVVRERTAGDAHDANARVQPAKIAEALLREISEIALPTGFALSESDGVEDVADFSLATARGLARALARLDALLELAASVAPGGSRTHRTGVLDAAVGLEPADADAVLTGLGA